MLRVLLMPAVINVRQTNFTLIFYLHVASRYCSYILDCFKFPMWARAYGHVPARLTKARLAREKCNMLLALLET